MKDKYSFSLFSWMRSRVSKTPTPTSAAQASASREHESDDCNVMYNVLDVRKWPKKSLPLLLAGFLSVLIGFLVVYLHPYEMIFRWKVQFSEGGEIFDIWRKPPIDLYLRVYLFNVTNADRFMSGEDEKLNFQQVGPYVYKELVEHGNVSFNENGTVSAVPLHPLVWVPEMSEGHTEQDKLILPNIAVLSITEVMSTASYFTRLGLNMLIKNTNTQPLVEMTAKEFMFGYQSELVTLGNTFMPNWISFDKLGLIDRMYDFEGDFETVYTGRDQLQNAGLLETYRGSEHLPQWPDGEHCSSVKYASDGVKFKGYVQDDEELKFFRKSLCRAAPLRMVEKTSVGGLAANKYIFKEGILDNGKVDPRNKCFCRKGKCLPAGLIDVTDCYYGFPIALSYPHFLDGDDGLITNISGVVPVREKHQSEFYVNPVSGLPLSISAKIQINMALSDISNMAHVEKFSHTVLPMLWFEIVMFELSPTLYYRFFFYLNIGPVAEFLALYISFLSGVVLISVVIYKIIYKNRMILTQNHQISRHWMESPPERNMDEKLSTYLQIERRGSMTNRELELYYSGLVAPLNQSINMDEEGREDASDGDSVKESLVITDSDVDDREVSDILTFSDTETTSLHIV